MRHTSSLLAAAALLLVVLAGCTGPAGDGDTGDTGPDAGGDGERTGMMQLPVGESAWNRTRHINISSTVSPSTVRLEEYTAVAFHNRNGFAVTVDLDDVDTDFNLSAGETITFAPPRSTTYNVYGGGEWIGSGNLSVR